MHNSSRYQWVCLMTQWPAVIQGSPVSWAPGSQVVAWGWLHGGWGPWSPGGRPRAICGPVREQVAPPGQNPGPWIRAWSTMHRSESLFQIHCCIWDYERTYGTDHVQHIMRYCFMMTSIHLNNQKTLHFDPWKEWYWDKVRFRLTVMVLDLTMVLFQIGCSWALDWTKFTWQLPCQLLQCPATTREIEIQVLLSL